MDEEADDRERSEGTAGSPTRPRAMVYCNPAEGLLEVVGPAGAQAAAGPA